MHVCMYICMYIHHTLISVGSLVARAYRHDVHMVAWTLQMQALCKWTLIEPEQSLYARKRKQKQGVTKEEERECDRVSKKRYKHGHRRVGLARTFLVFLAWLCTKFKQIEETQTVMQLIISSQGYKQLMFYTGHSL